MSKKVKGSNKGGGPQGKRKKTVLNWDQLADDNRDKVFATLAEQLDKSNLSRVELEATKQTSYPSKDVGYELVVGGECSPSCTGDLEKYEEFVARQVAQVSFEVNMVLGPGDSAAKATVFDLQGKELELLGEGSPESNKAVLLHFWLKGADPTQIMHKFVALTGTPVKQEAWAGKVRVVTINLNDELKDAADEALPADSELWANVWGGSPPDGEDEGDSEQNLRRVHLLYLEATQHLPESVLINQLGQVVKRGHLTETELEAELDALVAQADQPQPVRPSPPKDKKQPGAWTLLPAEAKQEAVKEISEIIASKALTELMLMVSESRFYSGGQDRTEGTVMLCGDYEHTQEDAVCDIFAVLKKFKITDCVPMIAVKMPKTPLKLQPTCVGCKAEIAKDSVRFHCACCVDPYTVCAACEAERSEKLKGHPQHHVFFRVPVECSKEEELDTLFHIGDFTTYPAEPSDIRTVEDVFCNVCKKGPIAAPRYKCAHCVEYDICGDCVDSGLKETKKADEEEEEDERHEAWHILVKLHNPAGVRLVTDGVPHDLDDDGDEADEADDADDAPADAPSTAPEEDQ